MYNATESCNKQDSLAVQTRESYNIVRLPRTNRRECTHCEPFGQCEWGANVTLMFRPDLPPSTLEADRGIGSANVKRALHA